MADPPFDPSRCDLCGSDAAAPLIALQTGRAMRSDRGVVPHNLLKLACERCGLVRGGQAFDAAESYYASDYGLSVQPEHLFFTPRGPVTRSSVLADWLVEAMGAHRWSRARRCLEIGAGAGLLLQELMGRFPHHLLEGVELSRPAVTIARERGLPVRQGEADDRDGPYDIIYTIAVIEHVPSPTRFLQAIRRLLPPGGLLFLCQPTQDVPSYDLFFFDHLHHFGSRHLQAYADKCGFHERGFVVGHELMPNFSMHMWEAAQGTQPFGWHGPPHRTACAQAAGRTLADMERLDATLAELEAQGRRVAAFGLNEVYWLARAYSRLGSYPLVCGLDDTPDRPEYRQLAFPVVRPEEAVAMGVQDGLLTMNTLYYRQAGERLEQLGIRAHAVLSP